MTISRIQIKRGTKDYWNSKNPTLYQGELGLDTTDYKFKIGDGTSRWNALSFYGSSDTLYFKPENYGAKGDAVSLLRATISGTKFDTISDAQYTFTSDDIGKDVYIENGWQTNGLQRKIANVVDGKAILDSGTFWNGTKTVLFGTDDTLAIEACIEAAATSMLTVKQLGQGADPVSWGGIPTAGTVKLRSGTGYLVKNTQTRYNSGKLAAINIPRHVGFEGSGINQTAIYVAPGNYGHCIANSGINYSGLSGDEKITIGGFSLYCMRGLQGSQCLDGIHWATRMGNYTNVDNFSVFHDIQIYQSRGHGFYCKGRGECLFYSIWVMNSEQAGFYVDGMQDTRWVMCNAGGNGWAGMYLLSTASCSFDTCKSFYNGASGGTDRAKCANWYLGDGSQYRAGTTMYVNCESQESRGSGWYIRGGLNLLVGCLSSDPRRFGSSPFPDICAGLHIEDAASMNVFDGFYCHAALGLDWSSTTENHYGGDYAVYIGRNALNLPNSNYGPRGNKGTIYTLEPSHYNVSKLGGPGITNRLNSKLCIDGEFLPSDWPGAPTISSIVYSPTHTATVTITPPASDGGRDIKYYTAEYQVVGETTWTEFRVSMVNTPLVDITGLVDSTDYKIRVAAHNINGRGTYSGEYAYTHTPTAPFQVTGVSGINGSTQVILNWAAPVNGGSIITDYLVEYKLSSEPTVWTTFSDGTSTATTVTVTGLTNSSDYDFRVSAINAVGTGPSSTPITRTPLAVLATVTDANLLVYLDASVTSTLVDGGDGTLETWTDLSGLGNNATQTTEALKPLLTSTINSINCPTFSGASPGKVLIFTSSLLSTLPVGDFTMFFVYKCGTDYLTQTQTLLSTNDSSALVYVRGDVNDAIAKVGAGNGSSRAYTNTTDTKIITVRRLNAQMCIYVGGLKGNVDTYQSAPNPTATSMWIGRTNQYYGYLDAAVGAIAGYHGALSFARCNEIGAVLASRFGVTWVNIN